MRIRKRPVLFPSWLSPLRLSDPHLINRSPVVVQLSDATSTAPKLSSSAAAVFPHHAASAPPSSLDRCQPSDQPLLRSGNEATALMIPPASVKVGHTDSTTSKTLWTRLLEGKVRVGKTRERRVIIADGRWYEGEKAIPLKKRRGNFEENNKNNAATHSKKMKVKMKTKMNKKCSTRNKEIAWERN
ncbi:hypothetical protein JHK87_053575 [Glycine soja]|nr:hypothetical protein JHK87_053575 [Glycine soja]